MKTEELTNDIFTTIDHDSQWMCIMVNGLIVITMGLLFFGGETMVNND